MTTGTSTSTSTQRIQIDNPSAELVAAIAAHVELPAPSGRDRWEFAGVRSVVADVRISRVTTYGSDGTTEQPIIFDEG